MRIEIDARELVQLGVDISKAPMRIQMKAPAVLRTRVGPKLEREMKDDARGHKGNWFGIPGTSYITPLPQHVSHQMVGMWSVEAGIEMEGAGKLQNIIVFGVPGRNPPTYDHTAAGRRTLPHALRWLAGAAEESVLGRTT